MIHYPYLKEQPSTRQVIDTFKGYNHNLRIGSGEFYEMENLTSDDYPVLSTRKKRGFVGSLQDVGNTTGQYFVSGVGIFVSVNGYEFDDYNEFNTLYLLDTSGEIQEITSHMLPGPKSLALIGQYLIVAPDMIWVNINDLSHGDMFHSMKISEGPLYLSLYLADDTPLNKGYQGIDPPSDPQSWSHWLDTTNTPPQVKRYSVPQEKWVTVENTKVQLQSDGLEGSQFRVGDVVNITGLTAGGAALNGLRTITDLPDRDAIVVDGIITAESVHSCKDNPVRIERNVPKLDFIVECANRIWGCSRSANEIYACKLGDFKNWNCFQRLSTDSWVGSVGTPGEFTGAVVQNGYPVFYKENCKHKVWSSSTGAHQMTTVNCDGVEKGSESSLAVCDGTVFYKSAFGVFADDGGGTVEIGKALGDDRYRNAVGAIYDRKYYLSMEHITGKRELFVYDIARGMWHRENSLFGVLCTAGNSLYCVRGGDVWDLAGNTGTLEDTVSWMAVTGDLGLELPEQKYISRLTLRLSLEPGATLEIFARYDREPEWVKLGQVYGTDLRSFSLPVRPRRCDQLRLKLQGTGMCKLYSITETLEKGSELA